MRIYISSVLLKIPLFLATIYNDPFETLQKGSQTINNIEVLQLNGLAYMLKRFGVMVCAIVIMYKMVAAALFNTPTSKEEAKSIFKQKIFLVLAISAGTVFLDFLFKIGLALAGVAI